MKPDRPGIWEWFDEDGTKRLVEVVNALPDIHPSYLRVYWWGGYYNVENEEDNRFEWPDRWGKYIGSCGSIPLEQLYLGPSKELREKILKELKNS